MKDGGKGKEEKSLFIDKGQMNQDRQIAPNRKSRAEMRQSNQRWESKSHFKSLDSTVMIKRSTMSYAIIRGRDMRALNAPFMKKHIASPRATNSQEAKQ